jgi:hypothetical protein
MLRPYRKIISNGVYFVELALLSDHNNIVAAIADATGISFRLMGANRNSKF